MEVTTYTLHPDTTEEDLRHLRMAVDEGRKCTPGPTSYCVGAVVVTADGRIFAGYTHETSATHHAEQEAIAKALAAGAELRGAAELGSCRQRLGDGLLLGVVRCGSFVRVTCKYPAVGRDYDRTDAVGRRAGGTFAAFVDRHPQVAQVFFRRVGMQRVGRHLHAVDLLAGVRDALGRRCAEPCRREFSTEKWS